MHLRAECLDINVELSSRAFLCATGDAEPRGDARVPARARGREAGGHRQRARRVPPPSLLGFVLSIKDWSTRIARAGRDLVDCQMTLKRRCSAF